MTWRPSRNGIVRHLVPEQDWVATSAVRQDHESLRPVLAQVAHEFRPYHPETRRGPEDSVVEALPRVAGRRPAPWIRLRERSLAAHSRVLRGTRP